MPNGLPAPTAKSNAVYRLIGDFVCKQALTSPVTQKPFRVSAALLAYDSPLYVKLYATFCPPKIRFKSLRGSKDKMKGGNLLTLWA